MSEYFTNPDWLNARCGRFTASCSSKLFEREKGGGMFGKGAMTYIREKVAEDLTQTVKDQVDFKQAEWGYSNEHEAYRLFEQRTGLKGVYYGIANPMFFELGDSAGGSPDWESEDLKDGADFKAPYNSSEHILNLQLSTVDEFKAKRWEYYCQGQMNMKIRGWERFHFVSYDPRMPDALKLKIITMTPDAEWLAEFDTRLQKAIEKKQEIIDSLMETPPIILATHDHDNNVTIVEQVK